MTIPFAAIATLFVFSISSLVAIVWRFARHESRIKAVEVVAEEFKEYRNLAIGIDKSLGLVLLNQKNFTNQLEEVKDDIKEINKTLHLDRETHLACPYYPMKKTG